MDANASEGCVTSIFRAEKCVGSPSLSLQPAHMKQPGPHPIHLNSGDRGNRLLQNISIHGLQDTECHNAEDHVSEQNISENILNQVFSCNSTVSRFSLLLIINAIIVSLKSFIISIVT
jgi:hypothetical protein